MNPGPQTPPAQAAPVIGRDNVAALIPSYFEQRHIADVVRRVKQQLDTVLVVDDGSTDETGLLARDAGAQVITHEFNQGKGAAIKTGLRALSARPGVEYILILDGDGQHLPEEIPLFLAEAKRSRAAMIVGNRMSDVKTMPWLRKATNRFMSWQISLVCRQRIPDTQCGFRMVRRDMAAPLYECKSSRFDFETEMLAVVSRRGERIGAVAVSTIYGDEISKIRPLRDAVRFLQLMRRLRYARKAAEARQAAEQ